MNDSIDKGALPVVAVVGRPNVGKSSLFNRLCGRRMAVVHNVAGTTRDRVTARVDHKGRHFEIVDTGGMGIEDVDGLTKDIESQIEQAMAEADVVVFVTDVRDGIMPLDQEVARRLRKIKKPVVLAVNKTDSARQEPDVEVFQRLGFGQPVPVSAVEGLGRSDLLDRVVPLLPDESTDKSETGQAIKLAVVGRRNVGKSTLINHLCGAMRVIVSEIPGTTRDAVDVPFEYEGLPYVAIDTAGMRKKRKVEGSFEFYSQDRARRAVARADVVILMLDALAEVGNVDKMLASFIVDRFKPVVIAVNRWDLAKDVTTEEYQEYLEKMLTGLTFAPIAFISAKTGAHVDGLMKVVRSLYAQAGVRVTTGRLNQAIEDARQIQAPPPKANRQGRIYYATQVGIHPPTVIAFVNDPTLFSDSYRHYLANSMRARLPYSEVPVRIDFRRRAHER